LVRAVFVELYPQHVKILTENTRTNLFNLRQLLKIETNPDEDLHRDKLKLYKNLDDEYEEIQELGKGRYGRVIKARNRRRAEPFCALKLINLQELTFGRTKQAASEREYTIMAFLLEEFGSTKPHANVVGFERAFAANIWGVKHMVFKLEYVDGKALRHFTEKEQLPATKILDICCGVFAALEFLHGQGIIHRDVKPDNVIFNQHTNVVTVVDLGLAGLLDRNSPATCFDGTFKGSLTYMSPDVLRRDLRDETLTEEDLLGGDVWAMGVILFQLITLKDPSWFGSKDAYQLKLRLSNQTNDMIAGLAPAIGPYLTPKGGEYEWLVLTLTEILKKEQDERPTAAKLHKIFREERYGPDSK
jgi:serine/threonine protein kinase